MKTKNTYKLYKTTLLFALVAVNTLFGCVHAGRQLDVTGYNNNAIHSGPCYVTVNDDPSLAALFNHQAKLCKGTQCLHCKKEHDQKPRSCDSELCDWCESYWSRAKNYCYKAKKICLATNKPKAIGMVCLTGLCFYVYYHLYHSSLPSDSVNDPMGISNSTYSSVPFNTVNTSMGIGNSTYNSVPSSPSNSSMITDYPVYNPFSSNLVNNPMVIDQSIYSDLQEQSLSMQSIKDWLSRGLNVNAKTADKGDNLAILAADEGDLNIIKFIKNNGGDLNQLNNCGRSAFHHGFSNSDLKHFFMKAENFRPCPGPAPKPMPSYCKDEPSLFITCSYNKIS